MKVQSFITICAASQRRRNGDYYEKNSLFKKINNEELDNIFKEIHPHIANYYKNDIIAEDGDTCNKIGIVLEGMLELSTFFISGDVSNLITLKPGDTFAEGIIFSPEDTYPISILAIKKSKILYLTKEELLYLMNKNPIFLENYLFLLSKKLLFLNDKFKLLSLSTIRGKIAHILINLSKKQNSLTVKLPFTKEKMAIYISNKRPSISREFKNMKNEGIIDYKNSIVKILDMEKLKNEVY